MNRHARRAARAVNDRYLRALGEAVQRRDRVRDGLAEIEARIEADRLAGFVTAASETRLAGLRAALAIEEANLNSALAEAAIRDEEISAATLAAAICHHLSDIGLDALN